MIREANIDDLNNLLHLYLFLHEKEIPESSSNLSDTWKKIISDKNHHIILNIIDGIPVSSCVCVIILNITVRRSRQSGVARATCRTNGATY